MARGTARAFVAINAGMGVLFLISAVLQYNDPDPLRWIVLWAAAAAACFIQRRFRQAWLVAGAVCVVALLWAALLAPTALPGLELADLAGEMKAETPQIELGREILGLLIIAVWMAVLVVVGSRGVGREPA